MRIADPTLRKFWRTGRAKGIDPMSAARLEMLLTQLDVATSPDDMNRAGYGFHRLKGDRKSQYAVEVRAQWRIVFEWQNGEAVLVRLEDYHGN
jgi:toxin HigB-1